MSNIVTIGYSTEGTTDQRFLETIIKRTIEDVASECQGEIYVFDPIYYKFPKPGNFVKGILSLASEAHENGIFILCVHADADDFNVNNVMNFKIKPAFEEVNKIQDNVCKNIVPIIPVTMSEAWMLADVELLKNEIGTDLSDKELDFHRHPETIANPKAVIENAIRITQEQFSKKRYKITIGEIYQSIGQQLDIDKLNTLKSYQLFKTEVIKAFKALNYLH
jgi:hypothetical protein